MKNNSAQTILTFGQNKINKTIRLITDKEFERKQYSSGIAIDSFFQYFKKLFIFYVDFLSYVVFFLSLLFLRTQQMKIYLIFLLFHKHNFVFFFPLNFARRHHILSIISYAPYSLRIFSLYLS